MNEQLIEAARRYGPYALIGIVGIGAFVLIRGAGGGSTGNQDYTAPPSGDIYSGGGVQSGSASGSYDADADAQRQINVLRQSYAIAGEAAMADELLRQQGARFDLSQERERAGFFDQLEEKNLRLEYQLTGEAKRSDFNLSEQAAQSAFNRSETAAQREFDRQETAAAREFRNTELGLDNDLSRANKQAQNEILTNAQKLAADARAAYDSAVAEPDKGGFFGRAKQRVGRDATRLAAEQAEERVRQYAAQFSRDMGLGRGRSPARTPVSLS